MVQVFLEINNCTLKKVEIALPSNYLRRTAKCNILLALKLLLYLQVPDLLK